MSAAADEPEELDFLYRGRKSFQAHWLERVAAGVLFISFLVGCILASTTQQLCPTPFAAHNEDVDKLIVDSTVKKQCYWQGLLGLGMFCVFVFGYTLMRKFVLGSLLGIFVAMCVATPMVIIYPLETTFEYLKLFSVVGGLTFIQLFRLDNLLRHQKFLKIGYYADVYEDDLWCKLARRVGDSLKMAWLNQWGWSWLLWSALVINILEAVATEVGEGFYWNGLAGLWLVLAMPRAENWWCPNVDRRVNFYTFLRRRWQKVLYVDNTPSPVGCYDLVYETDWFWVLMYTSWNAAFSYAERAEHFIVIIAVLAAALYGEADYRKPSRFLEIDPHLYVQCRASTLAIRYLILAYFDIYEAIGDTRHWSHDDIALYWGVGNMSACVIYMIYKAFVFLPTDSRASVKLDQVLRKDDGEFEVVVAAK